MNAYQKINEMITARLIERIEATNTLPWRKPWTSISLRPRIPRFLPLFKPLESNPTFFVIGTNEVTLPVTNSSSTFFWLRIENLVEEGCASVGTGHQVYS